MGEQGSCRSSGCSVGIPKGGIAGVITVDKDTNSLMQALAGRPVSIAVDANPWQNYRGGVFTNCDNDSLDHAVLLVGYGTDNLQYWKVKNSWATSWGERGYIRMQRGGGTNCCGLMNDAAYATVSGAPSHSPSPSPSPSPTPGPSPDCKDDLSFCSADLCDFLGDLCRKTC